MDSLKELLKGFDPETLLESLLPEMDTFVDFLQLALRLCVMVAPLVLLGMGLYLFLKPPAEANHLIGFRSYRAMASGNLTAADAALLLPDRATLAMVWRYLTVFGTPSVQESPVCLCRKIVRWGGRPLSLGQFLTCLDIFRDVGLLEITRQHKYLLICPTPGESKADLNQSQTMQRLLHAKES